MPIVSTDIAYRISGGTANVDAQLSLGGPMSAAAVSAAINGLFDFVKSAEALAGRTEYRCIYVCNTNQTLTLYGALVWIGSNTPSPDTDVSIGFGSAGTNATEPAVGLDTTAPAGVEFSQPVDASSALVIGDLPPNAYRALWIKRVVNPNAAAYTSDGVSLMVQGDTAL